MYVFVCVCVHVYVCVCDSVCVFVCVCAYVYVCVRVWVYVCVRFLFAGVCVCWWVRAFVVTSLNWTLNRLMGRIKLPDKTPSPLGRLAQQKRRRSLVLPPAPDFDIGTSEDELGSDSPRCSPIKQRMNLSESESAANSDNSAITPHQRQLHLSGSDELGLQVRGEFEDDLEHDSNSESSVPPPRPCTMNLSESDEPQDQQDLVPHSPPSIAASHVVHTSRVKCKSDLNTQRRERYAERKLIMKAKKTGDDKLLCEALKTKMAKKMMPRCHAAYGTSDHFEYLAANTKKLLAATGGRHKKEVAHMLTKGLPSWFSKTTLGLSAAQLHRAKRELKTEEGRGISDACYAENVERNKTPEGLDIVFNAFFHRTTYQCSGADNDKARIMDKDIHEWNALMVAQWPALLRELADARPDLVPNVEKMPKQGWTDFEASILAATCQHMHYERDPIEEFESRKKAALKKYCNRLAQIRGCLPPTSKEEKERDREKQRRRTQMRLKQEDFNPAFYSVRAPQLATFRLWLQKNKLRFSRFAVPHPCPLCTSGPTDEVVYTALKKEIEDLHIANRTVPPELAQRAQKLRKSLRIYRVHLTQLATARAEAQKAEDELPVGSCMVIRDFVNHHDHSGKHVKCLHWVLMWRDKEGDPLHRLKLRHYCSDKNSMSTDSYYQADVTAFHLDESSQHCPMLFKDFNIIIFVGDHGPHFASHDTMYNESTLSRRYGKEIKIMFLASYHAYSRADGSGAEDSSALRRDLRAGMPRFGATAMKNMTNDSNDRASWAYEFPAINRNLNVFPPNKHFTAKNRAKWIKKWCEVQYNHPDNNEKYDGIVQYRLVSGIGVWQWTDLVAAKRADDATMCDRCSTVAQSVVYHLQADCPSPSYIHNLPEYVDLQPDPARISGPQMGKKKNGEAGKAGAVKYPCKYTACAHHTNKRKAFRTAITANRHMRIHHEPTDAEFADLEYKSPPAAEGKAGQAKRGRQKNKKKVDAVAATDDEDEDSDDHEDDEIEGSDADNEADDGSGVPGDEDDTDDDEPDEDDPDELVDMHEDQYVVKDIVGHQLLNSGRYKYRIAWEGTNTLTWEPTEGVNKQLREEYHQKVQAAIAAKAAEARIDAGRLPRRLSLPKAEMCGRADLGATITTPVLGRD